MGGFIDLKDMRFGRLLVVARSGTASGGAARWSCVCDCGTERDISGVSLRRGLTLSCGCYAKDINSARKLHGRTGSPEYKCWAAIKERCLNVNSASHADYGGRGISICERWQDSFTAFFDDMGPRPSAQHSIERLDNDQGYGPGNCCWATSVQQSRNKRSNKRVTCDGKVMILGDALKLRGMTRSSFHRRAQRGLTAQQIIDGGTNAP